MRTLTEDYSKTGNRYDLQYRTAADDRVREEHAALHGTTLPYDDPFWDMYYPPNGYGCRCTVIQVIKGKYKTSNSQAAIDIGNKMTEGKAKSIFRFNSGKTKKPYPSKHPYMPQGCGDCQNGLRLAYNKNSQACQVCMEIAKCKGVRTIELLHTTEKGNKVFSYTCEKESADFLKRKAVAIQLADINNTDAILTPKLHRKNPMYEKVYKKLIGTKYEKKCPDIYAGSFYEVEGHESLKPKNALRNMLNHALKQSNKIVIENPGLTKRYILQSIHNRIKNDETINEVWIIDDDKNITCIYKAKDA